MADPRGDDLMDDVRTALATLTSPWTVEQLAGAVGASEQDVRPCVDRLIAGGTIEPLGEDPRGDEDAPMLYGPRPFEDQPN
jgi:hypothetical protein